MLVSPPVKQSVLAFGITCLVLMSAPPAFAADPDPAAVAKAETLLKAEEKRIWRFAHITVKSYAKCECEKATATATGFRLTYTYTWEAQEKGKEVEHTTRLTFNFNAEGGFKGIPVGDVLVIGADTSKVKPGDGANVVVLPLRLYMKKHVADLPKSIRELIEKEIDEKIAAERMFELWLIFREHVGPPDAKDDK